MDSVYGARLLVVIHYGSTLRTSGRASLWIIGNATSDFDESIIRIKQMLLDVSIIHHDRVIQRAEVKTPAF